MKPALYDANGNPTHWRNGSDVVPDQLKLLRDMLELLARQQKHDSGLEAERMALVEEIHGLLRDPAAAHRSMAVDRLGGRGILARCKAMLNAGSSQSIRMMLEGMRTRPVA